MLAKISVSVNWIYFNKWCISFSQTSEENEHVSVSEFEAVGEVTEISETAIEVHEATIQMIADDEPGNEVKEVCEDDTSSEVTEGAASPLDNYTERVTEDKSSEPSISLEELSEEYLIDLNVDYPSDPALYCDKSISPKLLRQLLKVGPCQPGLKDNFSDFPVEVTHNDNRRFQKEWYVRSASGRCKVERSWLVFSPRLNKCFCFACWLFADKHSEHHSVVWTNPNAGFSNFKKGIEKIDKHEKSEAHRFSEEQLMITKFRLANDQTIISQVLREQKQRIDRNRQTVKRLLDCVLYLGKQGLAFRGHREHACMGKVDANEGNFLELIKLLAKYDALLADHVNYSATREKYLSHDIQNDLIKSVAEEILSKILDEVREAQYYSIIVDSTIDISRIDQFSLSLRYVTRSGHATEHFLDFKELDDSSAAKYFDLLVETLKSYNLDIKYCRGQGYDGASTMSGNITGLQQRVKDVSSSAVYIHCCAHNLNLVLMDAANSCVSAQLFFGTLESMYCFITSSLPRLKILQDEQEKACLDSFALTLKKLSDTRWASRKRAVDATCQSIAAIEKALERVCDGEVRNCTPKVVAEANGLLQTLQTFEFKFMLSFWQKILAEVNILSSYLQTSNIDLNTAAVHIETCLRSMQSLRSDQMFNSIEQDAKDMAENCGTTTQFAAQRIRRKKRFFDEMANDSITDDQRSRFKMQSYFYILDMFIGKLTDRFADFTKFVVNFEILDPKKFFITETTDISSLHNLAKMYSEDVESSDLVDEYISFKKVYNTIFDRSSSNREMLCMKDVLSFMIANDMNNSYPNLVTLYRIFLTLPVSSAVAERSFSRLKLIKNYLRSTMEEARLSHLAMISIEREFAERIDLDIVIDRFASMKARKMKL
jgi:hypothetical protein